MRRRGGGESGPGTGEKGMEYGARRDERNRYIIMRSVIIICPLPGVIKRNRNKK